MFVLRWIPASDAGNANDERTGSNESVGTEEFSISRRARRVYMFSHVEVLRLFAFPVTRELRSARCPFIKIV